MRPDEARSFDEAHEVLDCDNAAQLQSWADRYEVPVEELTRVCEQVGGHRTAVELKLTAPLA